MQDTKLQKAIKSIGFGTKVPSKGIRFRIKHANLDDKWIEVKKGNAN